MKSRPHDPTSTAGRSRASTRLFCSAIAAIFALYALSRAGFAPPPARDESAPSAEFSARRALATLDRLGAQSPHPIGSEAHARVRAGIVAELSGLGLGSQVQETIARGKNGVIALVRNVLARWPGRTAGRGVLLCAHYDSVAAGPGAGDDGAGVATLLEVARALAQDPPADCPVSFLFTDAEEIGLIGASGFVAEHPALAEVAVVVNVEARGTSGPSVMFETSEPNARLIEWFAESVERPSAISAAYEIYARMPNDTDLSVFKRAGLAGYNFAFIGGLRHYHTPLDDRAHLSADSVQHHGDNVLALARRLSMAPLETLADRETAPRRRVYADVLGLAIVGWPESASIPLALAALALVIAGCLRARAARELERRGVLWGAALGLGSFLIAGLVGFSLAWLLAFLRDVVDPWCAHPALLRTACFSGALAGCALLASVAWTRRAGFAAIAVGVGLAQALLALALALVVPSACYLFVLPACAAGIALLFCARSRSSAARAIVVLLPLAVAAVFWFPLAQGVELAFEFGVAPAITAWIGGLFAFAAPCFAEASPRARRLFVAAACSVALIAFAAARYAAVHTHEAPAPLSLVHAEDAATGEACWIARTYRWELPGELAQSARFGALDTIAFPWWPGREMAYVAVAPATGAPAPLIEVTAGAGSNPGERFEARVRSPRGARTIVLDLPNEIALVSVRAHGDRLDLAEPESGLQVLAGFGAEEIVVELVRREAGEVEVSLLDVVSGLPAQGRGLLAARPVTRVPLGEGDVSVVGRRRRL